MNTPFITWLMTGTLVLLQGAAVASNAPKGATFAGTIDDGTPKVIRMKKTTVTEELEQEVPQQKLTQTPAPAQNLEEKEEFLEDLFPGLPAPEVKAEIKAEIKPQPVDTAHTQPLQAPPAQLTTKELVDAQVALSTPLEPSPSSLACPVVAAAPKEPELPRTAGYRIPADKKGDILKRIKYAAHIAQNYGIAYDYRSMTVSDFSRIIKKLRSQAKR